MSVIIAVLAPGLTWVRESTGRWREYLLEVELDMSTYLSLSRVWGLGYRFHKSNNHKIGVSKTCTLP